MLGVVLAAGKGERLQPFTETRPKPLIPILDKPLISFSLELLKKLGIRDVAIVVSYMKDLIRDRVSSLCKDLELRCEFVDQGGEKGTAHAVKSVVEKYGANDLLVVYGDLYLDVDGISKALSEFVAKERPFIVGVEVSDVSKYSSIVSEGDRVIGIVEKPSSGGKGLAFAGMALISRDQCALLEEIPLSVRGEYELTDLASVAHKAGKPFSLVAIEPDYWFDVGFPWSIIEVHKKILNKFRGKVIKGDVEPQVTIKGPVVVEEGALVKGFTYIEGPVYIGRDAKIGPHAYLRPYATILQGAHIGFSVEVKESVVMEHTHAAHLTYIGDSVVGEHVNLGAGTILANLRFDERNVKVTIKGTRVDSGRRKLGALIGGYVKTGVNVSIVPGVKIGSYSIIYPGVTVYRDVPPKTVVKTTWGLNI